jgi:BTB/POZ domain-containing protein KCTD9
MLRRPRRVNGHNHVLYSTLLEEARFFDIDRLEKWLSEKKYLEAVKIVQSVAETDNLNKLATTVNGDVEIVYHPAWKKVRVYYCPDERPNHYNPGDCRHLCCGSGRN